MNIEYSGRCDWCGRTDTLRGQVCRPDDTPDIRPDGKQRQVCHEERADCPFWASAGAATPLAD